MSKKGTQEFWYDLRVCLDIHNTYFYIFLKITPEALRNGQITANEVYPRCDNC